MLCITAQRKTQNAELVFNKRRLEIRNENLENDAGNGKNLSSIFNNPASHLSPLTSLKSGFTLIEFLVVLGLLVMTVGSTLLFLTSILKGSNKANVTAEAKQNGQIVLDSIEKKIRNAVKVPIIGTDLDEIILEQTTEKELYLKCIKNVDENGYIALVEKDGVPTPAEYSSSPITNIDKIAGVDIVDCNFDVLGPSDGGTSPPIVTIRFTVNQGILAPSRKDFVANVQMQTSIALRQYNQ